jgi:hypothetical protein
MGHRSIISGGQRSRWAISARGTEKPAAMLDTAQALVAADDGPGEKRRRLARREDAETTGWTMT